MTQITFDAKATPEFKAWIEAAPLDDLLDSYVENYKDAHGIKARWCYGNVYTRQELADMFVQLGYDIDESIAADKAADARFMAHVESLGLKQWAADNKIGSALDLMEYDYRAAWFPADMDEPLSSAELLAVKAGFVE